MGSDDELKRDVEDELRWGPDTDEADVAVTVKDGVRGGGFWAGTVRALQFGSR
jgi:hypothetical protein